MYIYKTTNLINGKVYIGKSEREFTTEYLGSGVLLSKAIEKYGKENFKVELIEDCDTLDTLNDREKFWINEYMGDNCYNIAEGGSGGNTMSNHPNKKSIYSRVSNSLKGRDVGFTSGSKHSNSTKMKIGKANSGINNGNYNREFTKEERLKMSISQKKRYKDPNERLKANVFKDLTPIEYEQRCRVWSEASKGSKNGRFKYDKKVLKLDKKTGDVLKVYDYVRLVDEDGFNSKYVIHCCNKKKSFYSHKGFRWEWDT